MGGGGVIGLAQGFYREVMQGKDETGHPTLQCRPGGTYVIVCAKCDTWMSLARTPGNGELIECCSCKWLFTARDTTPFWQDLISG